MYDVEGRQPVLEALRSEQQVNKILIAKGERHGAIRSILELAKQQGVIVQEVDRKQLDSMSETRAHQGVIAQISPVSYWELDDILGNLKDQETTPLFLILDQVQDPHNLGSLIRSAECHRVTAVIIPKRRAAAVTSVVAKASAGAVSHMTICRVTNLTTALDRLKEYGCWVAGADMDGELCYAQNLTGPLALVIGSEGKGLSRLVKERCDFLVSIPLYGNVSSLNAGVAGGILLYEILRQRNAQSPS